MRSFTHARVENILSREYDFLVRALKSMEAGEVESDEFRPPWRIPALSERLAEYFAAATMETSPTPGYAGRRITVLDLMGNRGTRTTKTIASLVMVARAVRHIHETGEPVTLLTPTSANKGTALRDAVHRALETGLAGADQLNIVTLVPRHARDKLWSSPLSEDDRLAARNPVGVVTSERRDDVKLMAKAWYDEHATRYSKATGARLWYTLDIRHYQVADALRAWFEYQYLPSADTRLHAHAVSSAYGLLGHRFGARLVGADFAEKARYFLVQHLATPDMVLHLLYNSFSRDNLPRYVYDADTGLYTQRHDPRFPFVTGDPDEFLETTFYTSRPPTVKEMTPLIRRQGGGGIVVSLHECLVRYPEIRELLSSTSIELPADPRELREWSLVMAMTGLLNGLDRQTVPRTDDILLHASGSYGVRDFTPISGDRLHALPNSADELTPLMYAAAGRTG
ncbi:hypothetical protein Misp01_55230 [Microtetraspora sp. NBRC 13810]|uniref:DUF6002 family protein n=1 Tax=Microtetraspora sp. NBRC 13810 TaxID=3030990 RepID=UPI0024A25073|nr:DUF6002 family protein [Microtetraspora sp. NBRC 13810]GLW10395.1 hypothetical protein Misp01_55230 [Microtetraspora sp. NBRC 13810]